MTNDELAAQLRLAADILEGKTAVQKPAFQLPTPPPGMQWHRTNGWTEEMLPQGTRPICLGEVVRDREHEALSSGTWVTQLVSRGDLIISKAHSNSFLRTTRPLTFTHEGHEWTWHRAGDPMPCDGDKMVYLMTSRWGAHTTPTDADICLWETNDDNPIIGWRYADAEKPDETPPWIEWHGGECPLKDEEVEEWQWRQRLHGKELGTTGSDCPPSTYVWSHTGCVSDIIAYRVLKWREKKPKKTVPLGPEDILPGSVVRAYAWNASEWRLVAHCYTDGLLLVNCPCSILWEHLQKDYEINRSTPIAGKWDPSAWEPCSKEVDA